MNKQTLFFRTFYFGRKSAVTFVILCNTLYIKHIKIKFLVIPCNFL